MVPRDAVHGGVDGCRKLTVAGQPERAHACGV